ncbi:MAG: hypothetical protein HQK49_11280 [Oligoflexia bacterium]|nr:hypothetical protein [Oligoflexia bacterium]
MLKIVLILFLAINLFVLEGNNAKAFWPFTKKNTTVKEVKDKKSEQEQTQIQEQVKKQDNKKFSVSSAAINTLKVEKVIAQEQLKELQAMEVEMNELNDMMKDMHTLVTEQGKIIDNIEKKVTNTKNNVKSGINNFRDLRRICRPGIF